MTMREPDHHIDGVLRRFDPAGPALPLMFDSPHCGIRYPGDFGHDCPLDKILWGQDSFIDEIYAAAPEAGAWLVCADFPRTYIDANRALTDIDPTMLDGPWPGDVIANPKADQGIGLIWKNAGAGVDIYRRKLSVAEAENRIDGYWRPYHDELMAVAELIRARWGKRWHINCHSMFSPAFAATLGRDQVPAADVVLGDREGTTCDAGFVDVTKRAFEAEGLSVSVNERFKGVELVRKFGDPKAGCHSLQIELSRRLYMDEHRTRKSAGFDDLQGAVTRVIGTLARYVNDEVTR